MLDMLSKPKKCSSCNGQLQRKKNRYELMMGLLSEIMFWGSLALVVFGSVMFQYIGGSLFVLSIVAHIWNGIYGKSIWKCEECGLEIYG
jgi:ssDNA-binding Zn-finger/Zn-ribbon topoisomerase 1